MYFAEYPDDPIDVILLYQAAVTSDVAADTSSITHYIDAVTGPRFESWRDGEANGARRRLPNMQFLVGTVATLQPRLVLMGDGVERADVSGWYMYQRVDAYRKVDFSGGTAEGTLSIPAPGIMVHAVFEQDGRPAMILKSRSDRDYSLALLP